MLPLKETLQSLNVISHTSYAEAGNVRVFLNVKKDDSQIQITVIFILISYDSFKI